VNREVFAAVAAALDRGEPAALVTIVSTTGSTPQRVGAKMLVFGDGRIVGTIGGGCYENDALRQGARGDPEPPPEMVHYELYDDFAQETGLVCGGRWTSTSSRSSRRRSSTSSAPATSASISRGSRARSASASTSSTTARSFANASASRLPSRSSSTTSRVDARATLPSHAYVVIVTRGHTNDLEALRALAPRDLRYLGLIGSRAKVARIYEALVEDQMPPDL
jgi:xanthine dehydrogenase accessory factor